VSSCVVRVTRVPETSVQIVGIIQSMRQAPTEVVRGGPLVATSRLQAQRCAQQIWAEYYRLRSWARLSLVAIPVTLYIVLLMRVPLSLKLSTLSFPIQVTVLFSAIGLAAVAFAAPVLKWAEWPCPRCGWKFAHPKIYLGKLGLVLVLWRLVFDSRCSGCKLPCGAPTSEA
jgi:hypothetical protein